MVMVSAIIDNLRKFLKPINKKSYKVPFLAIECLHTLKLIHSIYASIELNRKVALSENLSSSKLGL